MAIVGGGDLEKGWVVGTHCGPKGEHDQLGFAISTPTTPEQHSRAVARHQTDLTDAEWHLLSPLVPEPCAMGRPRE
jgi:hypothetical protein